MIMRPNRLNQSSVQSCNSRSRVGREITYLIRISFPLNVHSPASWSMAIKTTPTQGRHKVNFLVVRIAASLR